MIEIIVGTVIYTATLIGCYDGDTCKVKLDNAPEIVAVQSLRFKGFDTPELKGKCEQEKQLAREAKAMTIEYMETVGKLYSDNGERGKYGRLLVTTPQLQEQLIANGLAREYDGGTRQSWCD